jgi:hypothetical protein
MKNINLKRVGSLHDKNVLTVGSSDKADIRLNHESVAPIHCRISAKSYEQRVDVSINALKGQSIKINDIEQPDKVSLSDKDLIGIGDFILLFSQPQVQQEVVAHLRDGSTMRGTPVTWNVGAPSFELFRSDLSDAEGTQEEISVVEFANLKAVFFLKGEGPDVTREKMNKEEILDITFADGEKIEGRPLTDYSDVSERFYVVPEEMPNISSILVERASVREVIKHKAPYEAKAGGRLAGFRKDKGAAAE